MNLVNIRNHFSPMVDFKIVVKIILNLFNKFSNTLYCDIVLGARGWRKYPTLRGLMEMVMTG